MSEIDQYAVDAGPATTSDSAGRETKAGEVAASAPLSASASARSGAMKTRVAGMMGALLTRLEDVTGGAGESEVPKPPAVPDGVESTPEAEFSALRRAPQRLRELADQYAGSPGQSQALSEAADVLEALAVAKQRAVFR